MSSTAINLVIVVSLLPVFHCFAVPHRVVDTFSRDLVHQSTVESTVCQSEECQSLGRQLKAALNESVDPCDDFYEFVCGQWAADHPVNDKVLVRQTLENAQKNIDDTVRQGLTANSTKDDAKSIVFARQLYKSCMDNDTRKEGVEPIKTFVHSVGGWPLMDGHFDQSGYHWQQSMASVAAETGLGPFALQVFFDQTNSTKNLLIFSPPLTMPADLIKQGESRDVVEAYKKLILTTAVILGAKDDNTTREQIDEIVEFEVKYNMHLIKEIATDDDIVNMLAKLTRMSLAEMSAHCNHTVNWTEFVNRAYAQLNSTTRVSDEFAVDIMFPNYFKTTAELISQTPARVVANYLGWTLVSQVSRSYGTNALLTARSQFEKTKNKAFVDTERSAQCLNHVKQSLPFAASRLYMEKKFTEGDKKSATALVNDLKDSFGDIIKSRDWLDTNTKNEALLKLASLRPDVGYPDWLLDNKGLDDHIKLDKEADPKNYLANALYLQHLNLKNSMERLYNIDRSLDSWSISPIDINAHNVFWEDAITVPAGILSPPYFYPGSYPAVINYGGIGMVLGHEMTHGYDTMGSKYDAHGNLRNWWTDSVRNKFNERADCFRNQYSNTVDIQTGLHLPGNKTIMEDIADNGGLQEAFNAYQKYVKREGKSERLPVIDKYSADQQFFISFTYSWCANVRTDVLKRLLEDEMAISQHSIPRYRATNPLKNFDAFSQVFKCGTNSPMNRKDKCVLW